MSPRAFVRAIATRHIHAVAFAIIAACTFDAASADTVRLLSAGAVEPGLRPAVAAFEKASGHQVVLAFATAPQIRPTMQATGNAYDAVIAPPAVLDELATASTIDADASKRVPIGRVGIGVVVRPGAQVPDISSSDALSKSILDADTVVFNRGSTGVYFESVLKRLGIEAQVLPKTTRYADGAAVMEAVLKGKGREIGFGAITEATLVRDKGLVIVGPLPADLQNYTTYTAAIVKPAAGTQNDAAQALMRFLDNAASHAGYVAAGIEPVR
jgi:molybdate transport system substrate-binding protein